MNTQCSRRSFVLGSLAAGVAISSRPLFAASANEQVNLGFIGCGDRGGQLLQDFSGVENIRVAGFADPDSERLAKFKKNHKQAKTWTDLRHMLDSPEIDAVVVATCNHWHCLAAIWAMQAGKHVYVEKPLSNTHWEGMQVVNAAKKYDRICQVGVQQRSDYLQDDIKQLLHGEKLLGDIAWVRVNRFGTRKQIGKRSNPLEIQKSVNYDLWLGPAADEPLYRTNLHYDWHWTWNTGAGEMGNWGVHVLDDVRNNVFLDKVAAPRRVVGAGGRYLWNDAGTTPNVQFAVLDTGSAPVVIALSNLAPLAGQASNPNQGPPTGYVVHCEGGRLEGQRGKAAVFDKQGQLIKELSGDNGGIRHQASFVQAIRENNPSLLKATAKIGHDSTSWCNLTNVASRLAETLRSSTSPTDLSSNQAVEIYDEMLRLIAAQTTSQPDSTFKLGPMLEFDETQQSFAGSHQATANALLHQPGRGPYVVPEVS